ncbi:pseudouridine synthase [Biscogniauxia mediterranea]|nr:pseudouridine synthase [Biscogniauxia mediterranea]
MVAESNTAQQPSGNLPATSSNQSDNSIPTPNPSTNPPDHAGPSSDADTAGRNRREGGRNRQFNKNNNKNNNKWGDKRKALSRKDYSREQPKIKRNRDDSWQERKRRKVEENGEPSYMSIKFSEAEIAAEERKPKRKVAVFIGYSGTGYHGLQINHKEKTIEGDIFAALVAAGAISKANATDPRKSSFVRCARTDKGVHAAGNMISLKLIIEDADIVKKINDELPPQIRVWGIQRTNNPFSCYNSCDSRWYEYLIPSYCLLPPHPESFLGKKVLHWVKEKGVQEEYAKRLDEVKDYWAEVEKNDIQPILDRMDPELREAVARRMHMSDYDDQQAAQEEREKSAASESSKGGQGMDVDSDSKAKEAGDTSSLAAELASAPAEVVMSGTDAENNAEAPNPKEISPVERALKEIRAAYIAAKRRYRVTPGRIAHLQEALDQYIGTKNFHNYTVQKRHSDPSVKRSIKSFTVDPEPIQINDTQWLSLKVHGQSFMMHQIRKMVGMAVLLTRCGTPPSDIVAQSYTAARISIPKAPGLGLLLERPVFENYNKRAVESLNLAPLDFGAYEKEIRQFKDEQIYRRIFELEEKENSFHTFFHQIDNFKSDYFLWATAGGLEAAHTRVGPSADADDDRPIPKELQAELGEEEGDEDAEGGEG